MRFPFACLANKRRTVVLAPGFDSDHGKPSVPEIGAATAVIHLITTSLINFSGPRLPPLAPLFSS
jgi:hypothetical protein